MIKENVKRSNTTLRSTWKMLKEQKTLPDLFHAIPDINKEVIPTILLSILATLAINATLFAKLDHAIFAFPMALHPAFISIGYLGLIYGVFILLWHHYNSKTEYKTPWQYLRVNGLWIFLLLMLIWSTISTVFSTNPDISFFGTNYRIDGLLSYYAYAGIFALAINVRDKQRIKLIIEIFAGSSALLALLCLINNPSINTFFKLTKNQAIFYNINHYGYYLCIALMSTVLLATVDKRPKNDFKLAISMILHFAELMLLSNALIICKSLGPFLAVNCALVALLIFTLFVDKSKVKRIFTIITFIYLIFAISSISYWDLKHEIKRLVLDLGIIEGTFLGELEDEDAINRIGSSRGVLWINAVKFIRERPLLGYGPDNLGERYAEVNAKNDRPHNEILQFAASLGIPAAIFYLLAMSCHLLMFIRNFKNIAMTILCAYCIIGAYLISSLFGNTMFYTTPFYFMLLGLSYSLIRPVEDGASENTILRVM
ncbi:MAG: O-antigen ligase family protein [Clostridia bacterium]|nr:O-antigen ligase family protein [Clostridia bacterium]